MRRFDVSKHRRFTEGLTWETVEPPTRDTWQVVKDAAVIVAVLLGGLSVYAWAMARDLEDQLETQKELTQKYIGHLSSAMNGEALLDRATNTAYFFSKPLEIKNP